MVLIPWAVAWEQQITADREYLSSGADKSVILLLHGIPDLFLPFAPELFPPLSIVFKKVSLIYLNAFMKC